MNSQERSSVLVVAWFVVEWNRDHQLSAKLEPYYSFEKAIDVAKREWEISNHAHRSYWVSVKRGYRESNDLEAWQVEKDELAATAWIKTFNGNILGSTEAKASFLRTMGLLPAQEEDPIIIAKPESFDAGGTLKNGAITIETWLGKTFGIVLAMSPGQVEQYVTWEFRLDTLATYWGHYHSLIADAVADYQDRIASMTNRTEEQEEEINTKQILSGLRSDEVS